MLEKEERETSVRKRFEFIEEEVKDIKNLLENLHPGKLSKWQMSLTILGLALLLLSPLLISMSCETLSYNIKYLDLSIPHITNLFILIFSGLYSNPIKLSFYFIMLVIILIISYRYLKANPRPLSSLVLFMIVQVIIVLILSFSFASFTVPFLLIKGSMH